MMNKINKNTRQNNIPGYLPALDFLRAICTILIFVFHNWQQTWLTSPLRIGGFSFEILQRYGYIAVDAFFVMSGFGLFYPIARNMFGESKQVSWHDFYIKRLRRILPSYYFMLILLLIFPVLSYTAYDVNNALDVLKHFGLHALFLHILTPETLGSVISTAWTMGIEVIFYIFFPIIAKIFKKKPPIVFAVIFIINQAIRLMVASKPDVRMYTMVNPILYVDIFAWGMLSAYLVVYVRNKFLTTNLSSVLMTITSILCLAGVYFYVCWMGSAHLEGYDMSTYHRLLYRFIPSGLFAGFLFFATFSSKLWLKFLGNKLFAFISTISYSFYLWHQNIHIFLRKLNIPHTVADPVMNDRQAMIGFMLLSIVISVAIAMFSTYCIEKPIVKYGKDAPKYVGEYVKAMKNAILNA